SVPEEAKAGTVVGRLAQDLGLEAGEAEARRLRLVAQGRRASVEVSGASGALVVSSRLDREELCGKSAPCALRLEVLVERPLRVFHVELEVTDIKTMPPSSPPPGKTSPSRNYVTGSRFPLEGASDHFSLDSLKSNERNIEPELVLTKPLDRETIPVHRLVLTATDGAVQPVGRQRNPSLSGHCKVLLEVAGREDNAPEVSVTSLSVPVPEDASVGTVVALLSVSDRDSGANGRVRCWVWPASPFGLEATFSGSYSLVLREALDRERVSEYEVEVRAEDGGAPPLRARRGVRVPVSDVNDNAPAFAQAVYTVLARENNAAGAELARLWARDPDEAGNGRVSYSVAEGGVGGGWRPASSYVSVDAESGRLWALQPLDFEELQVLQFEVRRVDAGEPPLCGNATVQLFVLDENDNAPALLPPAGSGPEAGGVVAKIRAVDADSGYNAWLRYELWEPRGKGPFRVGLYSGEVSTARALDEADGPRQRLVIVVRDHGEPARSATATLSVSLLEAAETALAAGAGSSSSRSAAGAESGSGAASAATNVWLVVAICAVSSLFLLAVVLYGASRWAPRAAVLSGPGPTTLVCASEVGSWSYSQRHSRSLCVADGAGKSDLMVFSPNFPPPPPGPRPRTLSRSRRLSGHGQWHSFAHVSPLSTPFVRAPVHLVLVRLTSQGFRAKNA
uniref:Cadherin domain-containing protein n=1 Tax=Malurus cyaneus samueli TaxID=2593467 RepID=A0A8C5U6P3_9PASS